MQCWDAECESFCRVFLRSSNEKNSSRPATALRTRPYRNLRGRWCEAVQSIDFSHFSRRAWSTLNNLTGRSRHSPCHCPVLVDAIASQLVRIGKYKNINRESSKLIFQEVFDLGKVTSPSPVDISGNFTSREFTVDL